MTLTKRYLKPIFIMLFLSVFIWPLENANAILPVLVEGAAIAAGTSAEVGGAALLTEMGLTASGTAALETAAVGWGSAGIITSEGGVMLSGAELMGTATAVGGAETVAGAAVPGWLKMCIGVQTASAVWDYGQEMYSSFRNYIMGVDELPASGNLNMNIGSYNSEPKMGSPKHYYMQNANASMPYTMMPIGNKICTAKYYSDYMPPNKVLFFVDGVQKAALPDSTGLLDIQVIWDSTKSLWKLYFAGNYAYFDSRYSQTWDGTFNEVINNKQVPLDGTKLSYTAPAQQPYTHYTTINNHPSRVIYYNMPDLAALKAANPGKTDEEIAKMAIEMIRLHPELVTPPESANPDPPPPVAVTGVSLDQETLTLAVGQTANITATVTPENAGNKAVTWSTSDPNIATVNQGLVTGVAPGVVTITVTTVDGAFTDSTDTTVTDETPPSGDSINWTPLTLGLGKLTNVFPFSLPWDLLRSFQTIGSSKWDAKFTYKLPPGLGGIDMVIDLSMWEPARKMVHTCELFCFDLGLIMSTRRLMGGDV